jgi:ABC-type nickel/cobalt efflux system permease component RcnA
MRVSGSARRNVSRCAIGKMLAWAMLAFLIWPPGASAHPMGNFSINHYAGISIEGRFVEIHYFIDMAEIPTFQEMQQNGIPAHADDSRVGSYLASQAENFRKNLFLALNGRPLTLETISKDILFSPGAGNLPTMKFGIVYRAIVPGACAASRCEFGYHDANFAGRLGWKEVVATAGHGVTIENSSAPFSDRSSELSNYPTDLISSPPLDVDAKIAYSSVDLSAEKTFPVTPMNAGRTTLRTSHLGDNRSGQSVTPAKASVPVAPLPVPDSQPAKLKPNQQGTPRNAFTELMAIKQIGFGFALLAAAIAAGLGALHALEPGHGKTIVAAYLVGSRGTARHAFLLGVVVTISHTAGVYLLGAITLYAQKYILPDRIYPFLAVLSGVLIAGMGVYLLLERYVGPEFTHTHGEAYAVGETASESGRRPSGRVAARQLLVLGITGGIVPCPAALVVLLSAVALHRTGFGLYLIAAFSIGLAAVLIFMGMAAVYAGQMMSRLRLEGPLVQRWLPMGSAAMIVLLGCGIAMRGLMSAGIVQIRIWG